MGAHVTAGVTGGERLTGGSITSPLRAALPTADRRGKPNTRVMIVDDHANVRRWLTALLNGADGIVVVGECVDGADVPDIAPQVQPDVVLMDVQMPRICGTDATRTLLIGQPMVRVLMISASMPPRSLQDAAAAGASGYVLKGGDGNALVTAIRTVAAGGTAWPGDQP